MLQLVKNLFLINGVLINKVNGLRLYDEALALHSAGEYKAAFPLMTQAAQLGVLDAMTLLGTMYLLAQGVREDGDQAITWLQKAVDAGYEGAVSVLGMAYATGKAGVPVDLTKARPLLERAASGGDEQSARMLQMMDAGVGVFAKIGRQGKPMRR